ncbi:hypothetical protein [Streptomyces sp. HUAS TT20]|uniref:hypothetical protein n=1 Tax=Streptomyces sp. HUAS TT20 TaxID=3447509 RepID=UPI0021D8F79A|nr:hypothetical protein [Streptomyces sp. HUAS 15-9]UXY29039.1 hypothetical protein N8I87_22450 [Streptomyces sp. HUAS 15-9]
MRLSALLRAAEQPTAAGPLVLGLRPHLGGLMKRDAVTALVTGRPRFGRTRRSRIRRDSPRTPHRR